MRNGAAQGRTVGRGHPGQWTGARTRERDELTDVVRSHGVDLFDLVAEGDGLVDDELDEVVRRGFAGEQLELAVDGVPPREDHASGDLGVGGN